MQTACKLVDELALGHLLSPLVSAVVVVVRGAMQHLLKEGCASTTASTTAAALLAAGVPDAAALASVETSKTVQQLAKTIPDISRVYLLHFPKFPAVIAAQEEFHRRILSNFISIAALCRPVTDQAK